MIKPTRYLMINSEKMKANPIQSLLLHPILLITGMLMLFSSYSQAQEKNDNEKTGKQKVSIHIIKEVDGVKTVIDTSFTAEKEFDVQQWMEENNIENDPEAKSRKIEREINISIPEIAEGFEGSFPDTIIVNGDSIFLGMDGDKLKLMMEDLPDMAEMNIDKFIEEEGKEPLHFEFHEMPENCPHFRFEGHPGFPPMHQFMIPELEGLMDIGNLDNIVIKKKRHGKKVIISFKDEKRKECPHHTYQFNEENHVIKAPKHEQKKVVIRHDKNKEVDENSSIQRIQDGDKEVIIIRKNNKEN
jgi:hypothetical protein